MRQRRTSGSARGCGSIGRGYNRVTPRAGNRWPTGNTNRILNPRDAFLLATESSSDSCAMVAQTLGPGDPGRTLTEMDIINATIQEWRDLGFHYDRDDDRRLWTIKGSISGIGRFSEILRQFSADARNDLPFEHDHYGPYMYLKIMNVPDERVFDSNAICAPRRDFAQLADLIDARLSSASSGDTFDIRHEFAPDSDYELRLIIADDYFDPGLYDPWVQRKVSEQ